MAPNMSDLQRQLVQRLNEIIASQHPAVQENSSDLLGTPQIRDSVFYGFALRRPFAYIQYVKERLDRMGRLPPGVELASDDVLEEELEELRITALIHFRRLPGQQRPAQHLVEPQATHQEQVHSEEEYGAALFRILSQAGLVVFAEIARRNPRAWEAFVNELIAPPTEDAHPLLRYPFFVARDIQRLRDETQRLQNTGFLPPMHEVRNLFWRNRGAMHVHVRRASSGTETDVLASEELSLPGATGQATFPGFRAPVTDESRQTEGCHDDQEPIDFSTHCVWCCTKFQEDGAQLDREPSRELPCGHVVGAICSQASGQPDRCPFRCM